MVAVLMRLPRVLRRLFGAAGGDASASAGPGAAGASYEQTLTERRIQDLFQRGRFFEIFAADGRTNTLRVQRVHDALLDRFSRKSGVAQMIRQAHGVLSANLYFQEWEAGRRVMADIEKGLRARRFEAREAQIWSAVWKELEERYHLKPELVTAAVEKDMARRYLSRYR